MKRNGVISVFLTQYQCQCNPILGNRNDPKDQSLIDRKDEGECLNHSVKQKPFQPVLFNTQKITFICMVLERPPCHVPIKWRRNESMPLTLKIMTQTAQITQPEHVILLLLWLCVAEKYGFQLILDKNSIIMRRGSFYSVPYKHISVYRQVDFLDYFINSCCLTKIQKHMRQKHIRFLIFILFYYYFLTFCTFITDRFWHVTY